MPEIISIAVLEPFEGEEGKLLAVVSELYSLMERKSYSRDVLFRSRTERPYFIHIRRWTSEEARQDAHEDPEVHRYWAQIGQLCQIPRVHEMLDEIDWKGVARIQF